LTGSSSVEWFRLLPLGTAAALVFPRLFLPQATKFAILLASFAVLVRFGFSRPADRGRPWGTSRPAGRQKAFLAALMTIGLCELC